jgi:hypothetical protein
VTDPKQDTIAAAIDLATDVVAFTKHFAFCIWLSLTPNEKDVMRSRFPDQEDPTCDCAKCKKAVVR